MPSGSVRKETVKGATTKSSGLVNDDVKSKLLKGKDGDAVKKKENVWTKPSLLAGAEKRLNTGSSAGKLSDVERRKKGNGGCKKIEIVWSGNGGPEYRVLLVTSQNFTTIMSATASNSKLETISSDMVTK